MRDPRLEKLADVLVNYSVGVKPGQLVRISGPPLAEPLVMELYRKVARRRRASRSCAWRPKSCSEIFLKHANDEQLRFVNPLAVFEYEKIDCSIGIWAEENTKALSNVDPEADRHVARPRASRSWTSS